MLLKAKILVSGELTGAIEAEDLLGVMDQIEEFSYQFQFRLLQALSRFAEEMRRALALRDRLRKQQKGH